MTAAFRVCMPKRAGGRIDPGDLNCYRRGIMNVMKHLGIVSGEPDVPATTLRLYGDGNVDGSVSSLERGFLIPRVVLLNNRFKGTSVGNPGGCVRYAD